MRAMLGDDERPRFRQIEDLPCDVVRRHPSGRGPKGTRRAQPLAAPGAGLWIIVDDGIGFLNPNKRRARMPFLPAAPLA
jgi:hypothetical protein